MRRGSKTSRLPDSDDLSPTLRWGIGVAGGLLVGGLTYAAARFVIVLVFGNRLASPTSPSASILSIMAGIAFGAYYCYKSIECNNRPGPGHCSTCGYDLRANESGRCPECGADVVERGDEEVES